MSLSSIMETVSSSDTVRRPTRLRTRATFSPREGRTDASVPVMHMHVRVRVRMHMHMRVPRVRVVHMHVRVVP